MDLFYIASQSELDLIVCADTPEEALGYWHSYYAEWDKDDDDPRVLQIKPSGAAGPLGWNAVSDGGIVGANGDG